MSQSHGMHTFDRNVCKVVRVCSAQLVGATAYRCACHGARKIQRMLEKSTLLSPALHAGKRHRSAQRAGMPVTTEMRRSRRPDYRF